MLTHAWLSANKLTSNANKLTSNANKSSYMLFGKHTNTHLPELKLQINNSNIDSSSELNFLDVHINTKLNWDAHINVVGKQNCTSNWHDKKLQHVFPKEILLSIYNML